MCSCDNVSFFFWYIFCPRIVLSALSLTWIKQKRFFLKSKKNLGDQFCNAIWTIYSHQSATLTINSDTSKPFSIEKGTRQGCPLSPLLFILVLETLLCQVSKDDAIRGLQNKNCKCKYWAFPNDIMFVAEQPEPSLTYLLQKNPRIWRMGRLLH